VIVLGLLCTAGGFVVYAILIGEAGTSRATVITYVNPVVAVTLGVALLGEHPGAGAVAGLLLILAGGWLATDGRLPPGAASLVTRAPRLRRREPYVGPSTRREPVDNFSAQREGSPQSAVVTVRGRYRAGPTQEG
jgi:hypothetical protein